MKKEKKSVFEIHLELNGTKLVSSGSSVLEALLNLPKPSKMTTKVIFTIFNKDKKYQEVMMPIKAKRLFYPLARKFWAKNIEHLLK